MTVAYNDLTIESDAPLDTSIEGVGPLPEQGWKTVFVPIVDATTDAIIGAEVRSSTNCLRSLPIQIWRRVLLNSLMRSVLWRQRDRSVPAMSITMPIGLRHLASPLFTRSVRAAVAGSGVNPSLHVSDANIQLCIEGPNAGAHLARHREFLSFDQIQIPMHDAAGDPSVHRMAARAHGLDLEVVASNICDEGDLNDARRFGARYVVGPYFSDDDYFADGFSERGRLG